MGASGRRLHLRGGETQRGRVRISNMKIAIIGTGIAGNGAAYALATGSHHAITVYEKALRPGGHTATVDIDYDGTKLTVDTGFIVYNEPNYPNLTALFRELGIATQPSDMGLSVSLDGCR